ncbi:(2,3-dihydroxybenzoyl)adenylate synthase [Kineosporia succinea]|uniref:2,3-dihydroxybenzoate-AMP ligase n=1 Tax=Kineosporia succinea TaxID=84632 RepID=A0ABT9PB00_9ACTN|nr:AMP-binding protein [Kineosporia succinea]MDP9829667.1 2,3-dihydroxybenzoate-AMP ligase [Kineosporia succinea]
MQRLSSNSGALGVPWPQDAARRYRALGLWEGRSLASRITEAARPRPGQVCLVDGDVRITYGELMARADGLAERLAGRGMRPGDRVVVQMPNCWEFVVVTVACLRLGLIPVWSLMQFRRSELAGVVDRAQARALVVMDHHHGFDHEQLAHEVAAGSGTLEHVLVAGTPSRPASLDLRSLLGPAADPAAAAARLDAQDPGGSSVATLLLSGGTTGVPKLIARTNDDLGYMMREALRVCGFGPDTVLLCLLPVAHGFTNLGPGLLGTLIAGGRVVMARSPSPELVFGLIERERVTAAAAVPAVVDTWVRAHRDEGTADLSSLRLLQVGAAKLHPGPAARIGPVLGARLQQVFGMGEGLLCMTRPGDPDDVVMNTQGRPVSPHDEVRIVDEEGLPVPDGEGGLLLTRGPYTPVGYYDDPVRTAEFYPSGWYVTGDLVRRAPGGNLVVLGRQKDLINRGGEKIDAAEIEELVGQLDGVREVAAVAVPDERLGEALCLYLVPEPGSEPSLDDVRAFMTAHEVARFKLPARMVVVPHLPRTAIGKIDKRALGRESTSVPDGSPGPAAA